MTATTRAAISPIGQELGGKDRVSAQWVTVCRATTGYRFTMQGHDLSEPWVGRIQPARQRNLNSICSQNCLVTHGFIVISRSPTSAIDLK
jgi:hypothetical protein